MRVFRKFEVARLFEQISANDDKLTGTFDGLARNHILEDLECSNLFEALSLAGEVSVFGGTPGHNRECETRVGEFHWFVCVTRRKSPTLSRAWQYQNRSV